MTDTRRRTAGKKGLGGWQNTKRYVCPQCGNAIEAPKMWLFGKIHCDADGAEMRPMDDEQK